jgi:hypothetical protein
MYDLTRFTLREMTECGIALRRLGSEARTMEGLAQALARHLFDQLRDGSGERACVLARFFKTHSFGDLPDDLQRFAMRLLKADSPLSRKRDEVVAGMKCLTLLGTAGVLPEWNDRRQSQGHQAIPLPSVEGVQQLPMIVHLLQQLGLDVGVVVQPDPQLLLDRGERAYNIFHVPEAHGSPYVPAQKEFVIPHGIRSILGFGGVLPSGDLFVVILFTRVAIPRETAELFRTLALSVKLAVLRFGPEQTFSSQGGEL